MRNECNKSTLSILRNHGGECGEKHAMGGIANKSLMMGPKPGFSNAKFKKGGHCKAEHEMDVVHKGTKLALGGRAKERFGLKKGF
jgi:hypothetical protein